MGSTAGDRVWISIVGKSVFAVVNPLWACCREGYVPDRIYLMTDTTLLDNFERARNIISAVVAEHGKSAEIICRRFTETDFDGILSTLREIIRVEKERGSEVAVDMTPGRKFMSAIMMSSGFGAEGRRADRIYYLYLEDERRYGNRPWMRIPAPYQRLYEMKRCLRG